MDAQFVKVATEPPVAVVTLDRPPVNAIGRQVMEELSAAVDDLNARADVKVVIVTGGGQNAFVAGADINEIAAIQTPDDAEESVRLGQGTYSKIEDSPKPWIAAINGVCLGGGLELAMACHIRVAGDRVKLGQPEITLGMIPAFGGSQRLPRIVGASKATELMLTGDAITAQEAFRIGLVNKVVPQTEVLKQAVGLARKIAGKSALTIRHILYLTGQSRMTNLEAGFEMEVRSARELIESADMREGVRAFIEKRQPVFTDQ
jgi:enoyl-CoA hydratase/carnithine racemase